jgi:hypothetical protein
MKNRETWLAKERRQNPFAKRMDVENIIVIAENYICVLTVDLHGLQNSPAKSLYEGLGFEVFQIEMRRKL